MIRSAPPSSITTFSDVRLRVSMAAFFAVTLFLISMAENNALACKIPVFRYALEKWYPSNYNVVVLHRGPLDKTASGLVQDFETAASNENKPTNLNILKIDLDKIPQEVSAEKKEGSDKSPSPPDAPIQPETTRWNNELIQSLGQMLAKEYQDLKSPQLVLYFPWEFSTERPRQAWAGALVEKNVRALIDSPIRQKITKLLQTGESAVWVLIESGDKKKDDAAETTLHRELKRMEKLIKLPPQEELEADAEFQANTQVELRIGFSVLRIRRDDPAESIFAAMLLASEPDLFKFKEPIVIPVFGRGRTYYALVGKGINAEMIEEDCLFLTGDCSCTVKRLNPGTDLVFSANWDRLVTGSALPDQLLPELTGVGGFATDSAQESPKDDPKSSGGNAENEIALAVGPSAVSRDPDETLRPTRALQNDGSVGVLAKAVNDGQATEPAETDDPSNALKPKVKEVAQNTLPQTASRPPAAPVAVDVSAETAAGISKMLIFLIVGVVLAGIIVFGGGTWFLMTHRQD